MTGLKVQRKAKGGKEQEEVEERVQEEGETLDEARGKK